MAFSLGGLVGSGGACGCCGSPDCPCSPCDIPARDGVVSFTGGDAHGISGTGVLTYLGSCRWQTGCMLFTSPPEFSYLYIYMECQGGSTYIQAITSSFSPNCASTPIFSCDTDGFGGGVQLTIASHTCSPFHLVLGSAATCNVFGIGIAEVSSIIIDIP